MNSPETGGRWKARIIITVACLCAVVAVLAMSPLLRFAAASMAHTLIYGTPTDRDRDEAAQVTDAITATYKFSGNSISFPDRPPVFSGAGSKWLLTQPTGISIYSVRDPADQERVLQAVKRIISTRGFKPVRIRFLDHENWMIRGNLEERGPETVLKQVTISPERRGP